MRPGKTHLEWHSRQRSRGGQMCAVTGQEAEPGSSLLGPSFLLKTSTYTMKPIVRCPFLGPALRHSARSPATQAPSPCSCRSHPISIPRFLAPVWGCMLCLPPCEDPASGAWACLWVQSLTLDRCSGNAHPLDGWSGRQVAGSVSRSRLQKIEPPSSETSPWTPEAAGIHARSPLPHQDRVSKVPGLSHSPAWPGGPRGNLGTPVGSGSLCLTPGFHHPHCLHSSAASQRHRAAP